MSGLDKITRLAIPVKLLLLDVDGVLTDGKLYFGNNGEELKAFNIYDGIGIKWLQRTGVKVGIVTGRQSQLVARRAADLGIQVVVQGREDKLVAVKELAAKLELRLTEIAYMGDDLPDLSAITQCGLGLTVPNASPDVKREAHWTSQSSGGDGAVREACELIMKAQGTFEAILQGYRS